MEAMLKCGLCSLCSKKNLWINKHTFYSIVWEKYAHYTKLSLEKINVAKGHSDLKIPMSL